MSDNGKKYTGYGYHGGGRPKKEQCRVSFIVSCTPEERQAIRDKADKLEITVSNLVISAIREYTPD